MSGPSHYREAERLLAEVETAAARIVAQGDMPERIVNLFNSNAARQLSIAQVHATLALAAATATGDRQDRDVWQEATS